MEWLPIDTLIKALEPLGGVKFVGTLLFLIVIFFLDRIFKERAKLVTEMAESRKESAKLMGNHLAHLEQAQHEANKHFILGQENMSKILQHLDTNMSSGMNSIVDSLKDIQGKLDQVWRKNS